MGKNIRAFTTTTGILSPENNNRSKNISFKWNVASYGLEHNNRVITQNNFHKKNFNISSTNFIQSKMSNAFIKISFRTYILILQLEIIINEYGCIYIHICVYRNYLNANTSLPKLSQKCCHLVLPFRLQFNIFLNCCYNFKYYNFKSNFAFLWYCQVHKFGIFWIICYFFSWIYT